MYVHDIILQIDHVSQLSITVIPIHFISRILSAISEGRSKHNRPAIEPCKALCLRGVEEEGN